MASNIPNVKIRNAKLIFRNFSGKGNDYNREGDRNVGIILEDEDLISELENEGWYIRQLKPREEGEIGTRWIKANVKFRNKDGSKKDNPPKIFLLTSTKKVLLDEDSISSLDYAEIQDVRVELSPYEYNVGGKQGISAYVVRMNVRIIEDEFDEDYADLEESDEI